MDPFTISAEAPKPDETVSDVFLEEDAEDELEAMGLEIENEDGSVTITIGSTRDMEGAEDHEANLALFMSDYDLAMVAEDLLAGIADDDASRQEWLQTRARGLEMLGIKLEDPRGDTGPGSAPLEGMSTVRHPLLLEAVLRFQANARGELLPANGPVKVRNDGVGTNEQDVMASALEKYLNHYLTSVAVEYYPDTDKMLFDVGMGGSSFKKVYNDPILRRPVSLTVDADDLIVNNTATSLSTAKRITHRSVMKPSTLRRMQLLGAYRDIDLGVPVDETDILEQTKRGIEGIIAYSTNIEDVDYTIYECYCELDLPGFEHVTEDDEKTGLELPYIVTLERDSRQILSIRRNWSEKDDMKLPETHFVRYVYVDAIGFYGIGLLHILGNTNQALTAGWREMLDAGMFASFPSFLYSEAMGRQQTSDFRLAPGQGQRIQTGEKPIGAVVMPLPYKDPSPATLGLIQSIAETGQRVGNTSELAVGEGRADVPVGTTLAMIEQASKVMDAVHKRLHAAQAAEFALLKREFLRDPEALFRYRSGEDSPDQREMILMALKDYDLVPCADPNTPSHTHRVMKATALQALVTQNPGLFDQKKVTTRILYMMGIADVESLYAPPKPPPQPMVDPIRAQEVQLKAQKQQIEAQLAQLELELKAKELELDAQRDAERVNLDRQRLAAETVGWANEVAIKREVAQINAQKDVLRGVENSIRNAQGGMIGPRNGGV